MKFLLWSFFILGFFLSGKADQTFQERKSKALELLEQTKKLKSSLEALWKTPRAAKFDYLERLAEKTMTNMTVRVVLVSSKIDQLPVDCSDNEWMAITKEIYSMDRQMKDYYDTFLIEESKIRHLALAVLQCYEEDARIPEAAEFVKKVYNFIKNPEQSKSNLMWITESANSELFNKKINDFLHAYRIAELDDEEEMEKKEIIIAKWEVAYGRVLNAKEKMFTSLPVDTEERLNQALLNLAEFYRHKHRLRRFIDPSEDSDSPRYIAAGDKRLDDILLPVRRKNIHTEL